MQYGIQLGGGATVIYMYMMPVRRSTEALMNERRLFAQKIQEAN